MIHGLTRCPQMKDSDAPSLGAVPAHWDVLPIGRLGTMLKGRGGSKEDEATSGVPCVRYGDLYTRYEFFITSAKACVSDDRVGAYTPIQHGDVLFAGSGETIDDIGRSAVNLLEGRAVCGGDIILLRPNRDINPRFLGYAADAPSSRQQKATMGRGFTVVHIYGSELKRLVLAIPPLDEQAAIVRFLDHADRRIRRYIRAKQNLIKLLEEQKQAVIHRAVTRGLDSSAGLKACHVEGVSAVPRQWQVRSFARIAIDRADYRGATPTKTDSGIFLVTARNVRKGWIDYDISREYVASRDYATIMRRGLPKKGDLLFTMEAPLGHAALVDREDIALAQRVVRLRFDREYVEPQFVLVSVLSPYFQDQVLRRGTGSTALGIKASKLPQLQLLVPPLQEQGALLGRLAEKCRPMDASAGRARTEIALLREYRTRLIADVVTGKLDVREAAARLSDEVDDAGPLDDAEADADAEALDADGEAVEEEAEA